jgi:hypothetical protein
LEYDMWFERLGRYDLEPETGCGIEREPTVPSGSVE